MDTVASGFKNAAEGRIRLAPSLICVDLCNIEREVRRLEALGVDLLHIDILDGYFSPSQPIGLDMVKQLRRRTRLPFDVHIMAQDSAFFVEELLPLECQRICFHLESAPHPDQLLRRIRDSGAQAGLALKPSTPVSTLEDVIYACDFLLLMMINPGYAGQSGQEQIGYAREKVRKASKLLAESGLTLPIEVDGRISLQNLPTLLDYGARDIVCGTGTLFLPGRSWEENYRVLRARVREWEEEHDGR